MQDKMKDKSLDELFEAVILLDSIEECYNFFEDICTVSELKAMAQRLQVAKLLEKGIKYTKIVELTGASTATISRVNRCLNYGSDGYTWMLKKLKEK